MAMNIIYDENNTYIENNTLRKYNYPMCIVSNTHFQAENLDHVSNLFHM